MLQTICLNSMFDRKFVIFVKAMVGFKHIPQTITGKRAERILKDLPKKDYPQQEKSLVPLPDNFIVRLK